ncbi:MAG TPA: DUF4127 family protein [Limnochordales bacterium]
MVIVVLPLDERPCNHTYPGMLGAVGGVEVRVPPASLMGRKKQPADVDALAEWLKEAAETADGLVVAAETLAFGGLIPSRVVSTPTEQALARLRVLEEVRRRRPGLPIFVQGVIMRTPAYDSDDEEPPYWALYGRRLFLYSVVLDALERGEAAWEQVRGGGRTVSSPAFEAELAGVPFGGLEARRAALEGEIPQDVREEWRWRRQRNHRVNQELVRLVADGVVDFLALTQDDCFPLGIHMQEQRRLAALVAEAQAYRRVLIYPGADEVGLVLLARQALRAAGLRPRVGLRFSSTEGPRIVTRYEDRPLLETIKAHLTALGGIWEQDFGRADIALFVNSPEGPQQEAARQDAAGGAGAGSGRNLAEFLDALADAVQSNPRRAVALADVAYANGADRALVEMLPAYVWPPDLAAYAGWNTAGNTLGSTLAHAALRWMACQRPEGPAAEHAERAHLRYLALRFIEDWGYQAVVRQEMARGPVAAMGVSPYALGPHRETLAGEARARLESVWSAWRATWQPELAAREGSGGRDVGVRITGLDFPWDRIFEVGLTVEVD